MLVILSPDSTKAALEKEATAAGLPWAFISKTILEFVGTLRNEGFTFGWADDSDTANVIQPILKGNAKLALSTNMQVLYLALAQHEIDVRGAKLFGTLKWMGFKGQVDKFLEHLYRQNYFVVFCHSGVNHVIDVKIRLRAPQQP